MHVKSAIPKRTAPLEDLEDGTEVYCLRVPRGYDINLLKGITVFKTEDAVQYQIEGTTVELSMKSDESANLTLLSGLAADGDTHVKCFPIADEIELSSFPALHEPKDFDYKPMTEKPEVEETKDRSQLALTGMIATASPKKRKSKKSSLSSEPKKKKKKSS